MASYYVEVEHQLKDGFLYIYINNSGREYDEDDDDPWDIPFYGDPKIAYYRITYSIPDFEYEHFKARVLRYRHEEFREIGEEELDKLLTQTLSTASPWVHLEYMCIPAGIPLVYVGSKDVTWEEKAKAEGRE